MKGLRQVASLAALLSLVGCQSRTPEYVPETSTSSAVPDLRPKYRFGVRTIRSTRDLWAQYAPLVDGINRELTGFAVRLESAQTEARYDEKVCRGEVEFALVEPHSVLKLEELGYRVIARAGNRDRFGALILVRAGSGTRRMRQLRGRTMCVSSLDSLATMLVRATLKEAGLQPDRTVRIFEAGSEESAIMNLLQGNADAAAVSRDRWQRYAGTELEAASRLKVLYATDDLPGPAVMAHVRVSDADASRLQRALLAQSRQPAGKAALQAAGFTEFRPGEAASYDELWEFMERYAALFRSPRRGSANP